MTHDAALKDTAGMPSPAPPAWQETLPGTPDSVPRARRLVRDALPGCPRADDLALAVSELASNADAPRGALSYPRCSREELKGGFWA
jgi:hypothetical protein